MGKSASSIFGAMVDKVNNDPLSLAKAKKMGLRMARLPLDRYLQWGAGSGKSLTLNQMVNILLEMKKHGDWERALKYVPRRKLVHEDYQRNEQQNDSHNYNRNNNRSEDQNNNHNYNRNDDRNEQQNDSRNYNRNDNRNDFRSMNRERHQQNNNRNDNQSDNTVKRIPNYSKERKHYEKFKFDMNSWGSKKSNRKDVKS